QPRPDTPMRCAISNAYGPSLCSGVLRRPSACAQCTRVPFVLLKGRFAVRGCQQLFSAAKPLTEASPTLSNGTPSGGQCMLGLGHPNQGSVTGTSMRPISVYLDTSDYAALMGGDENTTRLFSEISDLLDRKLIAIGVSFAIVFEFLQEASEEYIPNRKSRAAL